ncbi:Negative regulator of mitotic exit [Podila minutissima]|nr:Negative regulator of mitotic exit [Podila minutissima]
MAGLFTKKKKDDGNTNTNGNAKQPPQQQRPAPPPNGLGMNPNGSNTSLGNTNNNNTNNGVYGGYNGAPGYNDNNANNTNHSQGYQQPPPPPPPGQGPMSPMSPTFSQHQHQAFSLNGPPSPLQPQGQGLGVSSTPATPQLFWTQRRILGANPFPRMQHTASITSTGTDIFLFGGSQRGVPKGDLFVIDSVSLQCQVIAPAGADQPMAKSGHTAVNIGQYVIYFGGWDATSGQCDDSLHVLHTSRKEWNKPPIQGTLPSPRHSHSGCSVGTTMYIFGGQVDDYYLGDIVAFDMKTITQNPRWEMIEPQTESPPARSGHCAAVHDGKIYIFGGADADYFYNDIWCFDTRALTWTPIPASGFLPTGRHGHSCTLVDGVLYVFGGNSPDGTELNDAYAFKIHERRWYLFQNVGPAASPRSGHTMCTIKDKIFILGGESEMNKTEDSAQIYYLELSKIRYPDANPHVVPPRQVSSARLVPNRPGDGSATQPISTDGQNSDYDSDRNSGPIRGPERPDRPDRPARPDRSQTQRPSSPATFATVDRQASATNLPVSQQTSQLINPQIGARPMANLGAPPPRGASSGFQNNATPADYQAEGLSIATRRQTMKDDSNDGYGGAVVGTASPVSNPNANRKPMQQMPNGQPANGATPSPLRVINVSSDSPPLSTRPAPGNGNGGDQSPIFNRGDRRAMNALSPPAPTSNRKDDEVNPYATEAISAPAPPNGQQQSMMAAIGAPAPGGYVPPPGSGPSSAPVPAPPGARQPLPPPPVAPSPPVSASIAIPPGADKKTGVIPPPPPPQAGQNNLNIAPSNRSPSPSTARGNNRAAPTPPPAAGAYDSNSPSFVDLSKLKHLEAKADAAQENNQRLIEKMRAQEEELVLMRKRENWLVAEVALARKGLGGPEHHQPVHLQEKRLSIADLEKELETQQLEGHQLKMTRALLKVKEELRNAKMSIATQAQAASFKIKEAERIRTGALQEAAYLKAKLSSMANSQQDPNALARIETDRAMDLEKRLTVALAELESLEAHYAKSQDTIQQEKSARLAADERSNGSTMLAEEAQAAHTRALAELSSLHSRAAKAEAESRDFAAQLAESQAGFSGHQSQSSGLLQKITSLKQQVEEHQTALERTQMAYSAANDRAMRAEALCDESSGKLEKLESQRSELSSDLNRYKSESERLQSKVEELEGRWQISKDEVVTLRKLVEDGLGAFNPRGRQQSAERKHDSIAILSTVSKVSELEHELSSLKTLHKNSQTSASKSAAELAEAMIEVSRLEQSSMKARAETISLQKQLAAEREGSLVLRNELSKVEQELEIKNKEVEDNEVQLGLLKDVMRERGMIAEDMVNQAAFRGTSDYASSLETKLKQSEERVRALQQELEETRDHFTQQLETFEAQRQATVQHSEKTGVLLRKMKNDLAVTIKEKETVELELKQLQSTHSSCGELATRSRDGQKEQEDERVQMLQEHWDTERRDLAGKASDLQNRLMDSEMHSTELSQKIISLTERIEEVETLNEAISEELESMQQQSEKFRTNALKQESQLKNDVEKLVNEIHQAQQIVQTKQNELEDAIALNDQLESQLDHALQAQAAAVAGGGLSAEAQRKMDQQRQELEKQLKKAQETIQILEGDNSVLEARLQDSEKKVALLLEDMQNSFTDHSNPNSPLNSTNLAGVHQQLNHQMTKSLGSHSALNSALNPPQSAKNNSPAHKSPSPHGLGINQNTAHKMSPYGQTHDEDDLYNYGQQNGLQNSNHYDQDDNDDENNVDSRSYRDSVDSITRELEMLKVPWNKTAAGVVDAGRKGSSPQQQLQNQQKKKQPPASQYNYYGNGNNTNGNHQMDMYSDEEDETVSYLSHLHRPAQQQQQTVDTHSFNDRSPSRLKEYEQMIDELATRTH